MRASCFYRALLLLTIALCLSISTEAFADKIEVSETGEYVIIKHPVYELYWAKARHMGYAKAIVNGSSESLIKRNNNGNLFHWSDYLGGGKIWGALERWKILSQTDEQVIVEYISHDDDAKQYTCRATYDADVVYIKHEIQIKNTLHKEIIPSFDSAHDPMFEPNIDFLEMIKWSEPIAHAAYWTNDSHFAAIYSVDGGKSYLSDYWGKWPGRMALDHSELSELIDPSKNSEWITYYVAFGTGRAKEAHNLAYEIAGFSPPKKPDTGSISGVIKMRSREIPIGGSTLQFWNYTTGEYMGGVISNYDGSYKMEGLPSGTYRVRVDPHRKDILDTYYNGFIRRNEAKGVKVTADKDTGGIGFDLPTVMEQGFIAKWLTLGPLKKEDLDAWNAELIEEDFLESDGGESNIAPSEGDVFDHKSGSSIRRYFWETSSVNINGNNLNEIYPRSNNELATAYLVSYLKFSKSEDVDLWLGSDDSVAAWMNGERVWLNPVNRGLNYDDDMIRVNVKSGWNILVVKANNGVGGWGVTVRFPYARPEEISTEKPDMDPNQVIPPVPPVISETYALDLDGNGDFVQTALSSNIQPLTIEAWFRTEASGGEQSVVDSDIANLYGQSLILGYWEGDNTLDVQYHNGHYDSRLILKPETWYHTAAVFTPGETKLYIFGNLFGFHTFEQRTLDGSNFRIGRHNERDPQWFNGFIDEVRIWNVALTQQEIQARMYATLKGSEPGLIGYWSFDDGTTRDLTDNGNHGVLHGDAKVVMVERPGQIEAIQPYIIYPVTSGTQTKETPFWVNIQAGDERNSVPDLFGISFKLKYTGTEIIDIVSPTSANILQGDFMGDDVVFFANADESRGEVSISITRKAGAGGVNGYGTLAKVKFVSKSDITGEQTIDFTITDISAQNSNGNPIQFTAASAQTIIKESEIQVWPGDTDNNGVVDERDVLPIGMYWAKTGPARSGASSNWNGQTAQPWEPATATYADANGDGSVDERDVLPIGMNWQKTHEASRGAPGIDIAHIDHARYLNGYIALLTALEKAPYSDAMLNMKTLLKRVISQYIPKENRLLPNYPNPFNPDTWIPYQLSKESNVCITIYDATGIIVKKLDIGRKLAGIYRTQDQAAYWDGRNEVGEAVASGIYFYTIQADDYTATKKMIVAR